MRSPTSSPPCSAPPRRPGAPAAPPRPSTSSTRRSPPTAGTAAPSCSAATRSTPASSCRKPLLPAGGRPNAAGRSSSAGSVLGLDGVKRPLQLGEGAAQLHHLHHLALDLDLALGERLLPVQLAPVDLGRGVVRLADGDLGVLRIAEGGRDGAIADPQPVVDLAARRLGDQHLQDRALALHR